MRGQKVYAGMGLIAILIIGQVLLSIYPTNASKHPRFCPPWCYLTYGKVESIQQTSAPLGPSPPAIAVSDQGASKELDASKKYAYVYADDGKAKVKVRIGHEVYEMFKETKTLVGFSVMENPHKSGKKDIPELLAFVPFEAGGIKPPTSPPEAGVALQAYMSAFRNCAQKDDCDSEGSAAQH